jgi:hypothetical protein
MQKIIENITRDSYLKNRESCINIEKKRIVYINFTFKV